MNESEIWYKPIALETTQDEGFKKTPYKIEPGTPSGAARPFTLGARISLKDSSLPLVGQFILDSGLALPVLLSQKTYQALGSPKLSKEKIKALMVNGDPIEVSYFEAIVTIGKISFDTKVFVAISDFGFDLIGSPIFNLFSVYVGRNVQMIMPRMDLLVDLA